MHYRRIAPRLSVLVILLLFTASQTPVTASPTHEILTDYFDENCEDIGWRFISCFGHVYYGGQQSGAYKLVERYPCDEGEFSSQWWYWNGSAWIAMAGPPPCWGS